MFFTKSRLRKRPKMATSSISLIRKQIHLRVLAFGALLSIVFGVFNHLKWIPSLWLGILFSGLIFTSLTRQNQLIANKKKQSLFFFGLMTRLGLYSAPLILAFSIPKYLNIFVVLLSLLTYQVHYVLFELKYFWQHSKNRLSRNSE